MSLIMAAALIAGGLSADRIPVRGEGQCRAEPAQRYVGRLLSPALQRQAQRASAARTVRVIRPGQAVTMDFRTDRLNIDIGPDRRVARIHCG